MLAGCSGPSGTSAASGGASKAADSGKASGYPEKTITLICQFSAGGSSDLLNRALAEVASKQFGRPVVVENKPGGSGTIGTDYVLKSKPDGYTLLGTSSGNFTTTPIVQGAPYDPQKDVTHIINIAKHPISLVVNSSSPWKTLDDLVQYCKKNPGKLKFGQNAPGGTNHMAVQLLNKAAGIKTSMVPYGGGTADVITALLGNHVDAGAVHPQEVAQYLKSGKLRMLTVMSEKRMESLPDVPTAKELGYDIVVEVNKGISGPAGMPADVVKTIHDKFKATMEDPKFIELAKKTGDAEFLAYEDGAGLTKDPDKMRSDFSPMLEELGLVKK